MSLTTNNSRGHNFHCSVCGGPLFNGSLRGSPAATREKQTITLELRVDDCTCGGADRDENDTFHLYGRKHIWHCDVRYGYGAHILGENQLEWLTRGRMVYVESEMLDPRSDDEYHDHGYYLTQEGKFNQRRGLSEMFATTTHSLSTSHVGTFSNDSPFEPRFKLGSWSDTGEIHLFRLEGLETTHQQFTVVGMCGHFMEGTITGFGLLTADLSQGTARGMATVSPTRPPDSEIHYRQATYKAYWARSATREVPKDYDPEHPPLPPLPLPRKVWTVFVDLSSRDITEIKASFDLVPRIVCRRLEFLFTDGSQQTVACSDQLDCTKGPKPHTLRLQPGETIISSDTWQSPTLGQHRFRFFTSYDRILHLTKPKRELKVESPNGEALKWNYPDNQVIVGLNFHVEEAGILSVLPVMGERVVEVE